MKRILIVTATLPFVFVAIVVVCSFLDGPTGPIPGGQLRTGTLVSGPDVDWSLAAGEVEPLLVEVQLIEPLASRTTGALVHDGQLYVPCDLGFVWRRVPPPARWLLSVIYRFKGWHEDALRDGRVVLRIGDKRYERQAVRVTAPELLAKLRSEVEEGAAEMFGAPLGPVPTDGPNDILFFRMEAR